MTKDVVVLSAVRSAVGTFNGSLAGLEPSDLAGRVMKEAIARSSILTYSNKVSDEVFKDKLGE